VRPAHASSRSRGRAPVSFSREARYPAFLNGHDDLLVEVPAGLLDNAGPEERIKAEVEEKPVIVSGPDARSSTPSCAPAL
jgi:hypothetical protein